MENLMSGDFLIRIKDESIWEFLHYGTGFITVRSGNKDFKGGSGVDKQFAFVKPVYPEKMRLSDQYPREISTNEFKKAPVDYMLDRY